MAITILTMELPVKSWPTQTAKQEMDSLIPKL